MAPESERAMYPLCTDVLRDQGKPYPRTCAECGLGPCKRKLTAPNPNEPTLTCSEVVERLRRNCLPGKAFQSFDVTKAAAILHEWLDRHLMQVRHDYRTELKKLSHSWRERRVQELEECLSEVLSSATPKEKEHPTMFAAWKKAEQIRKGAKHEY